MQDDGHRNSNCCIQETCYRFQEPIQGNLTGTAVEQQGIHIKVCVTIRKSKLTIAILIWSIQG